MQRSTLDAGMQRLAIATLRRQLAELSGRNVEDGAIVVLDNTSGEVLAWVGANGASSAATQGAGAQCTYIGAGAWSLEAIVPNSPFNFGADSK